MFTWRYTLNGTDFASISALVWHGPDGEPLSVDGPNDANLIDRDRHDMTRYAPILPVDPERFVTLGAGMTPLVEGRLGDHRVHFKLDSLLPTGSFKDRGAAVAVSLLRSNDIRNIIVDSSGNAAAAMAAYCAANALSCTVFAPASASAGKLVQSRAFGADVRLIDGPREAVAEAAQEAAASDSEASYVSHNWSPVFAEGVKTWAIEVWEQLGECSPTRVFVPTGGGSALAGAYRGFQAVGQLPRIVASQPAACAPLAEAVSTGASVVEPVNPGTTIAEGARISNPPRNQILLDTIRGSSGTALSISEDELVEALKILWRQGIYAEPTGALGAAAFLQAARSGEDLSGVNVVLITGSGLKSTETNQTLING